MRTSAAAVSSVVSIPGGTDKRVRRRDGSAGENHTAGRGGSGVFVADGDGTAVGLGVEAAAVSVGLAGRRAGASGAGVQALTKARHNRKTSRIMVDIGAVM
jgi:hypothetical protein